MREQGTEAVLGKSIGVPIQGALYQSEDIGLSCCSNSLVEWLLLGRKQTNSISGLLQEVCNRLVAEGIPLWRMYCQVRSLHPQAVATSYTWLQDSDVIDEISAPHGGFDSPIHLASPCAVIFEGAGSIRRHLDVPNPRLDFPILKDLHAQGATDYIAFPIQFSDGLVNIFSVTTTRPGGFKSEDFRRIKKMLPVLALRLECMVMRRTAGTLLNTYLGHHSGERVLQGLIKRGDSEDLHAVIWFCDLRDSTRLSMLLDGRAFLTVLNEFFDCMGGAVVKHGGEILRFMGDAMLAIFPIGEADQVSSQGCSQGDCQKFFRRHSPIDRACHGAIAAARDAKARMELLNQSRCRNHKIPLYYGVALHIGNVMYGNIGTPERMDFTVIGAAVNEAAQLENLCKILGKSILVSEEFATEEFTREEPVPNAFAFFESCGYHKLKGIAGHRKIYTLKDDSQI